MTDRTRKNIASFIGESVRNASNTRREYSLFANINILIKDPLPEELDLRWVLETVEQTIPKAFTHGIDYVHVGQFEELLAKSVNALFKDGVVYITNEQTDEEDMLDDIIHEIAHNTEVLYGMEIYSDSNIEIEFLGKRKRFYNLMKAEYGDDSISKVAKYFTNSEYDKRFDEWLYKGIGYPVLTTMTMGLFLSPYAITSLKEYYATGFTEYFLGDQEYVKKLSPSVYNKVTELVNQ